MGGLWDPRPGSPATLQNPNYESLPESLPAGRSHCYCWLPCRPPPSANDRLALTLIQFEFPRPFDTFDTWPFLVPLCSEMPSNTLFGKESPPFDTFDTLAVLRPSVANSDRMAFWGGSKHHLNTQNHRK